MALLAAGQGVASAILDPVCERLISIAFEEYALVRDVKEEIKGLKSTVQLIKGVLQDAEKKQVEEAAVQIWLRSLKQILLDAEDVLDEVATNSALRKRDADDTTRFVISSMRAKVHNLFRCFGTMKNYHVIAHQIKSIGATLDDKSREIDTLKLQFLGGSNENSGHRRPETSSLLPDDQGIIGRDDEKKHIKNLILGCRGDHQGTSEEGSTSGSINNNVHVITVVGMGGVGKTTLMKYVYNDPEVKGDFQLKMWVCVSNDFNLERIMRELMDATIPISDKMDESRTITNWNTIMIRLKEKVEGKKFLLVLDDMWEENDHSKWEKLCEPLRHGAKGSKIVVTTRSEKVSHNIVKGTLILLKNLSSEDLWSIFKRYAFQGCDSNNTHMQALEPIARQIAEKLKGSPLAAKTVGRLLNKHGFDVRYWDSILKSEMWVQSQDPNDILPILKLSYDHLSGHLKQCFAYCSLFPEDYIFEKDELVRLWMAQNFIQIPSGFHAESVGSKQYFDELVYTSFFEKDQYNYFFKMHDLIHDLAERVSNDDCLMLEDDKNKKFHETVRHVSIVGDNFQPTSLKEICELGKLRTLMWFGDRYKFDLSPHLDDLFIKLRRLRVLDLRWCKIKELPESIGTMKHLRYVNLSWTPVSKLPKSICNLHNLQVLNLFGCRRHRALPCNMSALMNLRHLMVDIFLSDDIKGLGKLTALQEVKIRGSKTREIADMGMLQQLRIRCLEEVENKEEAVQAKLGAKEHLDVLALAWSDPPDDHRLDNRSQRLELEEQVLECLQPINRIRELVINNYGGVRSPTWMEDGSWVSSSSLERVILDGCRNWEALPHHLSQLHHLRFLTISRMKKLSDIGPQFKSPGYFPSLEELKFDNMPEWEEWDWEEEHPQPDSSLQPLFLPCLRTLDIENCPRLKNLPPLPPTLTTLKLRCVGLAQLPGWRLPMSSSTPSLTSLSIEECPNLTSLTGGLLQHPLQNLLDLTIRDCQELVSLPAETALGHLSSLKSLDLLDCPKLSWKTLLVPVKDPLPSSLESIRISNCGDEIMDLLLAAGSDQKLTSLTSLQIEGSTREDLGSLPSSLEKLIIVGDDQLDEDSLSMRLHHGLTSLRLVAITRCPLITSLPRTEMLSHLTALQSLHINFLNELTSLGGIHSLISLQKLLIRDCPKLLHLVAESTSPSSASPLSPPTAILLPLKTLHIYESSPEQIKVWLLHCPSLQWLNISECSQLTCLDDDGDKNTNDVGGRELEVALLKLAPSLRSLLIEDCENLCSLPSKLRCLFSLKNLSIYGCPKIQCLPSAGLPESLEKLYIDGCPKLSERCGEEQAPDSHLISHIPDIDIRG